MPPKKFTPSPAAAPPSANRSQHTSASSAPSKPAASHSKTPTPSSTTSTPSENPVSKAASQLQNATPKNLQDAQDILVRMWDSYVDKTPQRTKLLDTFMVFLMLVGMLQFVYCVVAGNYPFNAFLAGFSATVGQFVLTASLRMQTNKENAKEFEGTSNERAFADFVFGSMILHFFCVNFIN